MNFWNVWNFDDLTIFKNWIFQIFEFWEILKIKILNFLILFLIIKFLIFSQFLCWEIFVNYNFLIFNFL